MTQLGRIIITCGILIFTAATLAWILTGNWQWFAGGGAILFGATLTSAILSVEPKDNHKQNTRYNNHEFHSDNWQRPDSPPPDQQKPTYDTRNTYDDDPFSQP